MAIQGFNRGHYTRSAPRVRFVRGWDATSSHSLSETLPIESATRTAGILSGDILAKKLNSLTGQYEWVFADADVAATITGMLYISKADSADTDVISAGKLTAVPLCSVMEISTGRFVTDTYAPGDLLTVGGTADKGKLKKLTAQLTVGATDSNGTLILTSHPRVGIVTEGVQTWSNALPADRLPSNEEIVYAYTAADMANYLGLSSTRWGTTNTGAGTGDVVAEEDAVIEARTGVADMRGSALDATDKLAIIKGRYAMDYGRGTAVNSEASGVITMLNFTTAFSPRATVSINVLP